MLIADGQLNRSVYSYLSTIVHNRGIPVFMDCSETTSFAALLETGFMSMCNWLVFNESSIQCLLTALNEKSVLKKWTSLSTNLARLSM